MPNIPTSQALPMFTMDLAAVYRQRVRPTSFLRSFFPAKEFATRYVYLSIQRTGEKVAVDVLRGAEGNRNKFSLATDKILDTPFYHEWFDITQLDLYEKLWASPYINDGIYTQLLEETADKMMLLVDKIERAIELQASSVLETGMITVADGSIIDYKRKAGSMVDLSGTPWTGAGDPYTQIAAGLTWLRQNGKTQGGVFNMIMGSAAAAALYANAKVLARGPLSNINFDTLRAPQRDAVGAASHGQITAGDYRVNLWTYPEFYDDANNVSQPYINPKKIILLPENPNFMTAFAAVPQLIDEKNPTIKKGAFVFQDFRDEENTIHKYKVKSAPLVIPTAIDQIYTAQVTA